MASCRGGDVLAADTSGATRSSSSMLRRCRRRARRRGDHVDDHLDHPDAVQGAASRRSMLRLPRAPRRPRRPRSSRTRSRAVAAQRRTDIPRAATSCSIERHASSKRPSGTSASALNVGYCTGGTLRRAASSIARSQTSTLRSRWPALRAGPIIQNRCSFSRSGSRSASSRVRISSARSSNSTCVSERDAQRHRRAVERQRFVAAARR